MNKIGATLTLIGLNVIVFAWLALKQQSLMMSTAMDALAILHSGGNLNPFTLGGQPWRILTSMFLHFGIIHLAVNMYGLFSLGRTMEPAMGIQRFLLVYFFCGIAAGIASLVFNMYTISAGASGAIFGLFGYTLGAELIGTANDRKRLTAVVINFVVFVVINTFIAANINVDIAGHLGGLVAGILLSVLHFQFRVLVQNGNLAIALVLLSSIVFVLPKDLVRYYRVFQRVLAAERHTNRIYGNRLDDAQLLDSLKTIVPEWDSIQKTLHNLKHVRHELTQDTTTLRDYITLSKQDALYRISLIERESYVYLDSLEIVDTQRDSLPNFQHVPNFEIPDEVVEQKPDSIDHVQPALKPMRIFFDANWKEINDPSLAAFYRIGTVDSLGRWQGVVNDFYRSGDVQMKGRYLDGMKDGVFLYYSNRNTYTSAGRYVKEDAVGKWENYHWNGALESEVYYNDNGFTRNVWDSLGRAQVVNGNGKYTRWHLNGKVLEEGNYVSGKKAGNWYGFHDDGSPYFREFFRDNRLVHGVSEDKNGKRYVYDHLSQYAFPVTGMPEFKKYLEKNIRTPVTASPMTGTVKVLFNVGNDGSVWDFVIMQSLALPYDQEAIRLIKEGPAWRPGVLHGHVQTPSQGYAEVSF